MKLDNTRLSALALIMAAALPTMACTKQGTGAGTEQNRSAGPVASGTRSAGTFRTAQRGDVAAGVTPRQFEQRRERRVMAADADGDGKVGRAEFLAAMTNGKGDPAKRFTRLDGNGDGFVDRPEIAAAAGRRFRRLDSDGDGRVSPQERTARHGGLSAQAGRAVDDDAG